MAKPSLIKLEFVHIPQEHFGAFWMFCEEHPGIQFKHQTPAQSQLPAKRVVGNTANGSTGKCIVLRSLASSKVPLKPADLGQLLVASGKAKTTIGGALHELTKAKCVKRSKNGYSITAAGHTFLKENCTGGT